MLIGNHRKSRPVRVQMLVHKSSRLFIFSDVTGRQAEILFTAIARTRKQAVRAFLSTNDDAETRMMYSRLLRNGDISVAKEPLPHIVEQ